MSATLNESSVTGKPPVTMWSIARRPRWLAALALALGIAAAFAALGQWQLERSFERGTVEGQVTEAVVALESVAQPQLPVETIASGQLVRVSLKFVPGDFLVLTDRLDVAGPATWVVGNAIVQGGRDDGTSLAVALGWVESVDAAASMIQALDAAPPAGVFEGRYLPSESPQLSDFEEGQRSAIAVAELMNLWADAPAGVYGGYLIASEPPAGLERIDAPAPSTEVTVNLLNIFYAIEWVVFGGFAVFLWWRLVRDEWEAQSEAAEGSLEAD
jgi:surfeit locus 1 family protein